MSLTITSAFFVHDCVDDNIFLLTSRVRDIPGALRQLFASYQQDRSCMKIGSHLVAHYLSEFFREIAQKNNVQAQAANEVYTRVDRNNRPSPMRVGDVHFVVQVLNEQGRVVNAERTEDGTRLPVSDGSVGKLSISITRVQAFPVETNQADAAREPQAQTVSV